VSSDETAPDESDSSPDDFREVYAEAFDRSTDPLAEYSDTFADLPDPFDYFIRKVVANRDKIDREGTIEDYERTYRQWREFMSGTDRHPACPTVEQIESYIEWRRDVHNNAPSTIKIKFGRLKQAYNYWQRESVFPHPPDHHLFQVAYDQSSFGEQSSKSFPNLTLDDLRGVFSRIDFIRARALIALQLKLGLRSSEVSNLQIQDIRLNHSGVEECYPELGSQPVLDGKSDALYVPPDRDGNKSKVSRVLPIDDELRWLLIRHLLTRPQVDEPWVFLSNQSFRKLSHRGVNRPWKDAFHPEYEETAENRAITSHFGRHWFSSYLRLELELEREMVQYMRGDNIEPPDTFAEAIDDYLHPNFDLIEEPYRDGIFKLDLPMTHYNR